MNRICFVISILLSIINCTPLFAQDEEIYEAFYIYRNDGEFNGFFYDEVLDMRYSKLDLDSLEHEDYVVQEVVTADSIYRIPLCVIDSVGFIQPEIIISKDIKLTDNNGTPTIAITPHDYLIGPLIDEDDPFVVYMPLNKIYDFERIPGSSLLIPIVKPNLNEIPAIGEIIHFPALWGDKRDRGGFLARVKEVQEVSSDITIRDKDVKAEYVRKIICEPITNIGDIYEQYITVERLAKDKNGVIVRQFAGSNKVRHRIEGSKELSFIDLSLSANLGWSHASVHIDTSFKIAGKITYNLSRSNCYIKFDFKEEGDLGLRFQLKGQLHEEETFGLGSAEIPVPSFFPILTTLFGTSAFYKTDADITLMVKSPKFKFKQTQSLVLKGDSYSGNNSENNEAADAEDDDNGWGLDFSINGSIHFGMKHSITYGTNTWASRIFKARIGMDMNIGPKFAGNFSVDLTQGKNLYGLLKNSQISFSPLACTIEAKAETKVGTTTKDVKFMEGELDMMKYQMNLFPSFKQISYLEKKEPDYLGVIRSYIIPTIYPFNDSPYYKLGVALADQNDNILSHSSTCYDPNKPNNYYSFANAYAERTFSGFRLLQGHYKLVPFLSLKHDGGNFTMNSPYPHVIYAWEAAKDIDIETDLAYKNTSSFALATFTIYGFVPGDVVTFELVSHEGKGSAELIALTQAPVCVGCHYCETEDNIGKLRCDQEWSKGLYMEFKIKRHVTSDENDKLCYDKFSNVYRVTATGLDGKVRTIDIPISMKREY